MLKDALSSLFAHVNAFACVGNFQLQRDAVPTLLLRKKDGIYMPQTVDKKLFSPLGGRIALAANERIAEFLVLLFKPSLLMSTSCGIYMP